MIEIHQMMSMVNLVEVSDIFAHSLTLNVTLNYIMTYNFIFYMVYAVYCTHCFLTVLIEK